MMPPRKRDALPAGITKRPNGRYQAQAGSGTKRRSKTFTTVAEARAWKRDTDRALQHGLIRGGRSPLFQDAAKQFLTGARDASIRTRSRTPYRPSTIRRYQRALEQDIYKDLGGIRLDEIRPAHLRQIIDRLQARGLSANTIRNALMPVQAIFTWAHRTELVAVDPTLPLDLPLDRSHRDPQLTPAGVDMVLRVLGDRDRPLWGTAMYAGLRRGELMALQWDDVDLAAGILHVQRSHDPEEQITGDPKTAAGTRRVPIPLVLRELLIAHRLRANPKQPLVFSRRSLAWERDRGDGFFDGSGVSQRAKRRWHSHGIRPISLHECRHVYASLMIAAMVQAGRFSPKALQTYLGHTSITTTIDRYGHLFPGNETEDANALQAFLDTAADSAPNPLLQSLQGDLA